VTASEHSVDVVHKVGQRLKEAREVRGLSLEEAAALASLSPKHLKEMEDGYPKPGGGRVQGPTLSKLERVANVYGLHVELTRD
jgi:transcriptional regulator with XRE-family HTH domain